MLIRKGEHLFFACALSRFSLRTIEISLRSQWFGIDKAAVSNNKTADFL